MQAGGHHTKEDYAVRGKEPKDEVQIYTWKDANLRELTDLVCSFFFFLSQNKMFNCIESFVVYIVLKRCNLLAKEATFFRCRFEGFLIAYKGNVFFDKHRE